MTRGFGKNFVAAVTIACALATAAQATVTISTKKTKNITCSAGVCTPTKRHAVLNVADLQTMLASSDVTVKTSRGSDTIEVVAPLTWTSSHRLTLDSATSIHVQAAVVVEGPGALTLITNDGGSGGDYEFGAGGYAAFWDMSSSLIINGASYTLVKDIATLASGVAANPSGNFALAASYDASVDGAYNHVPVATVFAGVFEGLGNTISNLSIHLPSSNFKLVGLFGQSTGSLRDIALTNVSYSTPSWTGAAVISGALAGENDGTVSHASATGGESGDLAHGGLIGINRGSITDSSATVGGAVGGLVEQNYSAITRSFATGGTFGFDTGGLAYLSTGTITQCYATGNVIGWTVPTAYGHAGGLVAVAYGTITQSFATGTVTAADGKQTRAGGLLGYLGAGGTVTQSYATGAVIGGKNSDIGGFAGEVAPNAATIQQSYSTGAVTIGKSNFAGGALGYDTSAGQQIAALVWDLDTSGIADTGRGAGSPLNDPGITGLTDKQLESGLPAGFDPAVWGQNPNINHGWPYLLANPPQ